MSAIREKVSKILVVGGGSIGRRHASIARQLIPNAQIMVQSRFTNDELPEGANGFLQTHEDALKFAPQAVVIANASTYHIDSATQLIDTGAAILIEKPISASSLGVQDFIDTCAVRNLPIMVGYNLRYAEGLQVMRSALQGGAIGDVLSVRAEVGQYLPSWRHTIDYRKSVTARTELGGGVLLELSHEIDYLLWILGDVEWIQAYCGHQSELDMNAEDIAHLMMRFDSTAYAKGAVAIVSMDCIRRDSKRCCVIIGSLATITWDAIDGTVAIDSKSNEPPEIIHQRIPNADDTYIAQWKKFLAMANGGGTDYHEALEALKVVRIVEAAKNSSQIGRRIYRRELTQEAPLW